MVPNFSIVLFDETDRTFMDQVMNHYSVYKLRVDSQLHIKVFTWKAINCS